MSSWFRLLEARVVTPEDKGEEEYKTFKRAMKGQRVTPSASRQEFLKALRPWRYTIVIPDESLPRGKAILAAKAKFFDPEEGAPAFFEPQRTLRIKGWDAQKKDDSWILTVDFDAQFKRKAGKRLSPTPQELEAKGFISREIPFTQQYRIEIRVPKEGIPRQASIFKAKPEIQKLLKYLKNPKVIRNEIYEDEDSWVVRVEVEGKPKAGKDLPSEIEEI